MDTLSNLDSLMYVVSGAAFILGLFVKHVFGLWVQRIPRLGYHIEKSVLAQTQIEAGAGKLEVRYNGDPVKNLYQVRIDVQNSSNKDFTDVRILLWCDTRSVILVDSASLEDSIGILKWTPEYEQKYANTTPQTFAEVATTREYSVPVLNRDEETVFSCLVTSLEGKEPGVYLECRHPGLKLTPQFRKPKMLMGERQDVAAFLGLAIGACALVPLTLWINEKGGLALGSFAVGALCTLPGIAVLKVARALRKALR